MQLGSADETGRRQPNPVSGTEQNIETDLIIEALGFEPENLPKIFNNPIRLEVTWDADVVDMVRCRFILKAYNKHNVLDNVKKMSLLFSDELKKLKMLKNIRSQGLLFAFDLETSKIRNKFVEVLFKNNMICNPTRDKTIRLRPHLLIKE